MKRRWGCADMMEANKYARIDTICILVRARRTYCNGSRSFIPRFLLQRVHFTCIHRRRCRTLSSRPRLFPIKVRRLHSIFYVAKLDWHFIGNIRLLSNTPGIWHTFLFPFDIIIDKMIFFNIYTCLCVYVCIIEIIKLYFLE